MEEELEIAAFNLEPEIASLLVEASDEAEVLLLPESLGDGRVQYREHLQSAKKELARLGVPADFVGAPDDRRFRSEYSASDIALQLVLGIASNASWASIQGTGTYVRDLANRLGARLILLKIVRFERADGLVVEGLEFRGPATAVSAQILRELFDGNAPSE